MIERFAKAWENPAWRARLLWSLWLISTGFTVFGFLVMFYRVFFSR